jgi:hypothetical protein
VKVVVPTERGYWMRMAGLFALSATIAGLTVAQVVHSGTANRAFLVLAAAVLLLPTPFLIRRLNWVASFDSWGVTLRNGKRFKWASFETCTLFVDHYDLYFKTGTARLYHRLATNQLELEAIANELIAGDNRFTRPRPS